MQKMDIETYMQQRWEGQYRYYSKAAAKNKKRYQAVQVVEITAAALIPFLSAWIEGEKMTLKITVGALGVLITVLSGMLLIFKFQENWVNYRLTAQKLNAERYSFMARTGPYAEEGAEQLFMERVEAMLGEENQKWTKYVSEKGAAGGKKPG